MSPLDRAGHYPDVLQSLKEPRWRRLGRRVAGLMLKALPDTQREEMISRKCLTTFGILVTLQVSYQPGGLGEKRALLKNLEEPQETSSAADAVTVLRKWIRWRHRANEIHATEPDPAVLMKGLTRLVQKVRDGNHEQRFRISLARSTLLVDTTPTRDSVSRYATHLLAELEQVAYTERKGSVKRETPKLKRIEDDSKTNGNGTGATGKPKEIKKDEDQRTAEKRCRFFNTEAGCRKEKSCKWPHIPDEKRRCYTCGSTAHYSSSCPTTGGDQPRATAAKEEGETTSRMESTNAADAATGEDAKGKDQMQSLIAEATQMLKTMSQPGPAPKPSLDDLQRQLDELRKTGHGSGPKLKTFRLTKMAPEGTDEMALLDSGATHPLRSLEKDDDLALCQKVWVALADGHKVPMLMTAAGVMLSVDQRVEPIIPLGWLADRGCRITWSEKGLQVRHPLRGNLPVTVQAGCPQVPKTLALEIIGEFEHADALLKMKALEASEIEEAVQKELKWLEDLVIAHPALRDLPAHLQDSLAVRPGKWPACQSASTKTTSSRLCGASLCR